MLEGCCCFGIRALRLVPDCHFRNRFHKRLFTSRFPPPWTVEETDAYFIVKGHAGLSLRYV